MAFGTASLIAALSGAGLTSPTGLLEAGGPLEVQGPLYAVNGASISDADANGVSIYSAGNLTAATVEPGGLVQVNANGYGTVAIGDPAPSGSVSPTGGPGGGSYPFVVAAGVNDTFYYTPVSTGLPALITLAPGSYATPAALTAAIEIATGNVYYSANNAGYEIWFSSNDAAGDTLTTGPTDVLADLGFSSPTTLAAYPGDALGFFAASGVTIQTISGSLSTVVDPAAQAVLTSIIAALAKAAGYGLILDGTT
jgi:hypothetical protein